MIPSEQTLASGKAYRFLTGNNMTLFRIWNSASRRCYTTRRPTCSARKLEYNKASRVDHEVKVQ